MIHELQSPLAKHLLNRLRASETGAAAFRNIIGQLTLLLADRAFDRNDMRPQTIRTWQGDTLVETFREEEVVFVCILRAALPMLEAAMELFPAAKGAFLAMRRDETTHRSKLYYDRVPECRDKHVVILDPMVATGGSLNDAVALLGEKNPSKMSSLHIIAAPEGVDDVTRRHPELQLYVAQIDSGLNGDKFIIPGLGDAGDRAFNTL